MAGNCERISGPLIYDGQTQCKILMGSFTLWNPSNYYGAGL